MMKKLMVATGCTAMASPTGNCKQLCVCPEEKKEACSGSAKMPEDYHIGPHGTDCQEWVDDMTSTDAR